MIRGGAKDCRKGKMKCIYCQKDFKNGACPECFWKTKNENEKLNQYAKGLCENCITNNNKGLCEQCIDIARKKLDEYQDKLSRRNMQIKELKKKIEDLQTMAGDALSHLNAEAFVKVRLAKAKEILACFSR